jgi:outer membrane lipoprotein carrier protein
MIRPLLARTFALVTLAANLSPSPPTPSVHTIASAVDRRYNHLQTLQTDFTEIYRGAGMERTESGTLWLKKPGKMRWQYRSPREKLFVSDGKDAWFYVPGEPQVRRTPVRQLDDLRSPLAFLLGKTKLEKELSGLSPSPDVAPLTAGNVVLRGVPQAMADRVNQVLIEVTPAGWIGRILLQGTDGSSTEFRFQGQTEDGKIDDKSFRFAVPPGVEVIDGNFAP